MNKLARKSYREISIFILILCLSAQWHLTFAVNSRGDNGGTASTVADAIRSTTLNSLPGAVEANQENASAPDNAEALAKCGGEGEFGCLATTEFFWDNGNLFCDRGLEAVGFKAIPGSVHFNSNDWVNLNRISLTQLRTLISVDFPKLKERLSGIDEYDFLSDKCIGKTVNGKCYTVPPICGALGCTKGIPGVIVPFPDFSKPGWDIPADIISFLGKVVSALNAAKLPSAIKDLVGVAPKINFNFSFSNFSIDDLDVTKFKTEFNKLKNFLTDNLFFGKLRGLIDDFFHIGARCVNRTREQAFAKGFKQTWAYWALLNQYELAKDEPLNWAQRLDAHNAYNNAADGYPLPNQKYSLTDQLNMGIRSLSLDIHWFNDQLRLCHGQANHEGCGMVDRYYSNAMKEIGNWLRANPTEVISINLEDRSGGHDFFVNEPIQEYLVEEVGKIGGGLVYNPAFGRFRGHVDLSDSDGRVPTVQEMRDAGRRVIIFSSDTHGDLNIWQRAENPFVTSRAKSFFFTNEDYDKATDQPPPYRGGPYRCVAFTPTGGFDFTRFIPDNRAGVFTTIYEARSLFDPFDFSGLLDESEVAQLAKCQVTEISLDLVNAKEETSSEVCRSDPSPETCQTKDNRIKSAIWSWRENDKGGATGDVAMMNGTDGRWSSKSPAESHNFACSRPRDGKSDTWVDPEGKDWKITAAAGTWPEGDRKCRQEFGEEYTFSVPRIGFQNEMLMRANTARLDLWLNYNDLLTEGKWIINYRPKLDAGRNQTVAEGQTVSFSGTAADDETVSLRWDFGDGSFNGAGANTRHIYADEGTYTVTLTALDQYGGFVSKTLTVTVNNVAPSLTLVGGSQTATTGSPITLQGASFSDPGFDCPTCASVSAESFTSTIDWGDGTSDAGIVSTTSGGSNKPSTGIISGSHTYRAPGEYTVQVCVSDDDQGSDCETFKITARDVTVPNIDGINTASSVNGSATASWGNPAGPGTPNSVTVSALGSGTITVAGLTKNPGSSEGFTNSNAFSYVKLHEGHNFREVTITNCRLNGGSLAYSWNGSRWELVSDQKYKRAKGCITMKINGSTSPSIQDLTRGTYFGIKNTEDQLRDLIDLVEGLNLHKPAAKTFDHALDPALATGRSGDVRNVCQALAGFIKKVNQETRKKLTAGEAELLIATANRIAGLLDCAIE